MVHRPRSRSASRSRLPWSHSPRATATAQPGSATKSSPWFQLPPQVQAAPSHPGKPWLAAGWPASAAWSRRFSASCKRGPKHESRPQPRQALAPQQQKQQKKTQQQRKRLNRRRRQQKKKAQLIAASLHPHDATFFSPPPAPLLDNEFYMSRAEAQRAQPSQPCCPPAPLITNESLMQRAEEQRAAEAAVTVAAAAAALQQLELASAAVGAVGPAAGDGLPPLESPASPPPAAAAATDGADKQQQQQPPAASSVPATFGSEEVCSWDGLSASFTVLVLPAVGAAAAVQPQQQPRQQWQQAAAAFLANAAADCMSCS